jgi:Zn-dependent M28 family amino/carboxypeptidase
LAFTGEERGLIGSARYVREPLIPLDKTVAMLNMDMVGRLADNKLIVHGTGTAAELDPLVDRLGKQFGFEVTKKPGGFGPSDHSSFYAKQIPVLHFFTGTHKDYHRPSDDVDKLNIDGMRRVAEMVATAAVDLAEAPEPPHYLETKAPAAVGGSGDRPSFGSIPDFAQDAPGYAISGVTKEGPAERGGLKGGDVIVQFGESRIGNLEDFDSALRKYKAGDKVPIVVKRAGADVKLEVTLDPPR